MLASETDVQEARTVAAQADNKADSASKALSNLTLTARAQADGPQIVDGSRWTWEATGTPDGGTVVAAAGGGYWHREFVGPVYATWFGCAADGVTLDDEPMGRARPGRPSGTGRRWIWMTGRTCSNRSRCWQA